MKKRSGKNCSDQNRFFTAFFSVADKYLEVFKSADKVS